MGDFTYKVTTSSGKSTTTTTYRFSYLILHMPWSGVPDLLIRREGMFDKIAGVLGFDDIDFESAQFSRRFHVSSTDKRFAYDVIDPRMMEFLLKGDPPTVDIENTRCCISDGRHPRRCGSGMPRRAGRNPRTPASGGSTDGSPRRRATGERCNAHAPRRG